MSVWCHNHVGDLRVVNRCSHIDNNAQIYWKVKVSLHVSNISTFLLFFLGKTILFYRNK